MRLSFVTAIIAAFMGSIIPVTPSMAEIPPATKEETALSAQDRLSLARLFMQSVGQKLKTLDDRAIQEGAVDVSNLPEGEQLLFQILLPKERITMDAPVMAQVHQGALLFSLRDFLAAMEVAIRYNEETKTFEGWFPREDNPFRVDPTQGSVLAMGKTFSLPNKVLMVDNDVLVPMEDLAQWFDFEQKVFPSGLLLRVDSKVAFPIQARFARQNRNVTKDKIGPPVLPLKETPAKLVDVPFVDVSTRTIHTRPGNGDKTTTNHNANVRTSGDFMRGNLTTLSTLDHEEKLTNFRATYTKETIEKTMLGPLGARKIQLGDVIPQKLTLDRDNAQGFGARVSNIHPLRSTIRPITTISGDSIPGWDVELYRGEQLLATLTVPEDGVYRFEDVELFGSNNDFRVVFYGPQGEFREESLFIPVDPRRLSDMGAAYDVSVFAQGRQTYRKNTVEDEDAGSPALSAYYEVPVGEVTSLSAGLETAQQDGTRESGVHAGFNTIAGGALINLNATMDNNNEQAAQLVLRRDFGDHQLRNEFTWNTDRYELGKDSPADENEVLQNRITATGPLPDIIGSRPKYNLALDYGELADGNQALTTGVGFSTRFSRLGFNQSIEHRQDDREPEDSINSLTQVTGSINRARLRFSADYQIKPDSQLERLFGSVRRRVHEDVDVDLSLERQIQEKKTIGGARVDWDAGFANISPGITYTSDRDLTATLNTRFGLARNPSTGGVLSFDKQISSNAAINAFVFLDRNGDDIFNAGDEPIEGVIVEALQNGGRVKTDETGYAFLNRLVEFRPTDVYVDEKTLPDPYWISANGGASIIPRKGTITNFDFPIHIAGELDGTMFARREDDTLRPLKGVRVSLYSPKGERVMSTISEGDGFYLFSKIPPGTYYLIADDDVMPRDVARPLPQKITIGYEGTTLYANNLYFPQDGRPDVPLIIRAATMHEDDGQKARDPRFILNLGTYQSQLMLGLMWYKLKTFYAGLLEGTSPLEKPSQTFPEGKDQLYTLRLAYEGGDFKDALARCEGLARAGQACRIEVTPDDLNTDTRLSLKAQSKVQ